jgi:hypothetical protein
MAGRSRPKPPGPAPAPAPAPAQAYAEGRRRVLEALERAGLGARTPEIEPLLRDAIGLVPRKARPADLAPGASRFGGAPDLPGGLSRAAEPGWEVDFVGQLDLAAVASWDIHHRLPGDGLLSFFLLLQGDETVRARVIYTPSTERLSADRPPTKAKVLGVDFEARVLAPPYNSLAYPVTDVPYETFYDELRELESGPERIHGSVMLGYDRADERALRADEDLLLRLDTQDDFYLGFPAMVCLYYAMPSRALKAHAFDQVRAELGPNV